MSLEKNFFAPKEREITEKNEILHHFDTVVTEVDRISISFSGTVVQGNFGFMQRFRNIVPVINIRQKEKPPIMSKILVQYHGFGSCWSFESVVKSFSPKGEWFVQIPTVITKNEARRTSRYFLSEICPWRFCSVQALGNFRLRDLSTMGCSLYFSTPNLTLQNGEKLKGTIIVFS